MVYFDWAKSSQLFHGKSIEVDYRITLLLIQVSAMLDLFFWVESNA
jgi:hypothetical protein